MGNWRWPADGFSVRSVSIRGQCVLYAGRRRSRGVRGGALVPGWLTDLFARYGYAAVFVGVFLENAGVPVPGETTVLAGGALSHYGHLSFPRVVIVAMTAAILGDNLGFYIGRRGGRWLVEH